MWVFVILMALTAMVCGAYCYMAYRESKEDEDNEWGTGEYRAPKSLL